VFGQIEANVEFGVCTDLTPAAIIQENKSARGIPMTRLSMPRVLVALILAFSAITSHAQSTGQKTSIPGHYLFVWTGDRAQKGNDFLAVIDADPSSPSYGHLVTTLATDQQTMLVHHTEYTMPASGMLFANDHNAGRTFIFDVRDPLHPKIATSFTDMAGYMHPHSYLRLPNGNVLATFQHLHHGGSEGQMDKTGGLVEIDDQGKVVRSVASADPAFRGALLMPYSLVVLPKIDRIVSTNSSMHDDDIFSGVTYQVWRLSDLKLLKTSYFDVGDNRYAHISPEEPRLGPDGSVFVQTLGCGIERITAVDSSEPKSNLVYTFPGNWCGVPTIVGHFLVQSVPAIHGFIVLDIAHADKPTEVSRLTLSDTYGSHWTGWDPKTRRLVVTPYKTEADRTYLLKLNETSGTLTVDTDFRDTDGQPGFSFAEREWPHGWKGAGAPHGAVFTR
jgi:56kDa selenium binding protein (SBP56)